jgi:uncharacterized protein (TIGR03086 family)
MDDALTTMGKVLAETRRVVDGIEPEELGNPTPCDDWSVRDVLNHITAGARMFAIAAEQGSVPDAELGPLLTEDQLGDDYRGAFAAAAEAAVDAFSRPGALDRVVTLPFGEMPARVAIDIAIFDVATHTWDLAKGSGQSTALDPEVLDAAYELAQAMISEEWRASGMFGTAVIVPDDAPVQDKLAALAGRAP